jgi:hypothetical protein
MRRGLALAILLLGSSYSFDALKQIAAATEGARSAQAGTKDKNGSVVQNSAGNATPAPVVKIDFQDAQPLLMSWQSGTRYRVSFFVRNDEPTDSAVSFVSVLQDDRKNVSRSDGRIVSGPGVIPKNGIDEITIEIDTGKSEPPLSGYLEMTAKTDSDHKPAYQYKPLKIPPPLPSSIANCLFIASLLASVAVVFVSLVWLKIKEIKILQRMGPPAWNFGDSWGTNITIGGALLSTLLGFSALPDQTHYLNKTAYLCLSLICAALISVAPSLYALLRTPVAVPGSPVPQYQGYVLFFALASGVTVWGTLGQLATVGLLFGELADAREISRPILYSLVTVLGLVVVLLLSYGCRTVVQIASQQQSAATKAGGAAPGVAGTVLPSWSVL